MAKLTELKLNTSGRRVRIEFLLEPGETFAVESDRAAELERKYANVIAAGGPEPPKGAQTPTGEEEAPKPKRKAPAKKAG